MACDGDEPRGNTFALSTGGGIGANHLAVHPVPGFVLQPATPVR